MFFLGIYALYWAIVETISGLQTRLIFLGPALIIFGLLAIRLTYQMFMPTKNATYSTRECPFCGSIVGKEAAICPKCKRQIDDD